ncbi:M64 family metallopeptidase [Crossiella sp. SN42]|uniref:M64 family metallopeptidase n=1 Tax=Crossiella sp. SN42 TaxID=2944808 RepID=UPI00207C15E0|nr:M64 family metallopeptidase [Crossiella sp. SN42]MCO1579264.1 M64 family metallopeptidase [Crossiella sp. SN42]
MLRPFAALAGALSCTALVLSLSQPVADAAPQQFELREVFSPDGTISKVKVPVLPDLPKAADEILAQIGIVHETGPSTERFDLVFVGDGYTAADLPTYERHVREKWTELAQVEPFKSLTGHLNVWRVDVVSTDSGVDHDPAQGVRKDTALDMGFWCQGSSGTERLLCVNETAAKQYAALAPQADQVIALGNTAKYGGAGGPVATAAGGNAQAGQIAIHELGHSMGGLADEYFSPGDPYTGPELTEPNASVLTEAQMREQRVKWHSLIGQPTPDGGVIGVYEGGKYQERGIFRPSQDSIMRTLGREFNLIGRKAMADAILAKSQPPADLAALLRQLRLLPN